MQTAPSHCFLLFFFFSFTEPPPPSASLECEFGSWFTDFLYSRRGRVEPVMCISGRHLPEELQRDYRDKRGISCTYGQSENAPCKSNSHETEESHCGCDGWLLLSSGRWCLNSRIRFPAAWMSPVQEHVCWTNLQLYRLWTFASMSAKSRPPQMYWFFFSNTSVFEKTCFYLKCIICN